LANRIAHLVEGFSLSKPHHYIKESKIQQAQLASA